MWTRCTREIGARYGPDPHAAYCQLLRDRRIHRDLWVCRFPRQSLPRRPVDPASDALGHGADFHAPGLHPELDADAARYGADRPSRDLCGLALCQERHSADYDLTAANLIPADAVTFIAAHTGRARILAEWIDPSVLDEANPDLRDPALDLYGAQAPQPPYTAEFVAHFRAAQAARIARITETAQSMLSDLKARGTAEVERPFIVHRTMADPRFLDKTLEPNGRPPNTCYLGVPETVNSGPVGLARFTTLRAWLSQWSPLSRADAPNTVGRIKAPLLVLENAADDAVPPSHPHRVFAGATMADKTYATIPKGSHYYRDQPEQLAAAVTTVSSWLAERGFAPDA
jgi:pimeloyl-ACP methyl ester carboxylesterase